MEIDTFTWNYSYALVRNVMVVCTIIEIRTFKGIRAFN